MTGSDPKKLVIYLMAEPETPELARAAVEGGADIVELGFPFSDPLADGPVIRRAGERALARGMRTRACLDVLAQTRALVGDTPLVPMTYSSLLEAYGWERFAEDVASAGATSMIVADLPAGERPETRRIQLVAPTSTDERIALAGERDGRLALPRHAGRHDRCARRPLPRARRPCRAGPRSSWTCRSTPASASRRRTMRVRPPSSSTASSSAPARCRWPRKGPEALREYVASLRGALETLTV